MIDIQSEQAATLHDYDQSKFCHNFTKIGLNRHRMGKRIDKFFIIVRLKAKSECPLGKLNPRPCAPGFDALSDSSGLALPAFPVPW